MSERDPLVLYGVLPFSNGSEFMDWEHRNCCECTKGFRDVYGKEVAEGAPPSEFRCDIQRAVYEAMYLRVVPEEIADRHGQASYGGFAAWCKERVSLRGH